MTLKDVENAFAGNKEVVLTADPDQKTWVIESYDFRGEANRIYLIGTGDNIALERIMFPHGYTGPKAIVRPAPNRLTTTVDKIQILEA